MDVVAAPQHIQSVGKIVHGMAAFEWKDGCGCSPETHPPIQSPTKEGAARAHPLIHSDFHFIGQVIQLPVILHIAVE